MKDRRIVHTIFLAVTLLLGEAWSFFPSKMISPYLFDKNIHENIQWYVNDISTSLTWIIFLTIWWSREAKNRQFRLVIGAFLVFRFIDLCDYLINHRHAGFIYACVYATIIGYVIIKSSDGRNGK